MLVVVCRSFQSLFCWFSFVVLVANFGWNNCLLPRSDTTKVRPHWFEFAFTWPFPVPVKKLRHFSIDCKLQTVSVPKVSTWPEYCGVILWVNILLHRESSEKEKKRFFNFKIIDALLVFLWSSRPSLPLAVL